ncbi:MAG: glycosyltransferase family 2 protein [Planctomycetes bacterium]|nr:glycosyltransferase family 2 protein [Planctomycetota bacterium]
MRTGRWLRAVGRLLRICPKHRLFAGQDLLPGESDPERAYELWMARRELPSMRSPSEDGTPLAYRPLMSVVMPVFNTPEPILRAAVRSVRAQEYPCWELCIADDASTQPHVRRLLDEMRCEEPRLRVMHRTRNEGISAASNSAIDLAKGEFVTFLDHDDELPPWALLEVVRSLNRDPRLDVIYSDEDKLDAGGRRCDPFFKPDYSPDLLLSMNYITHLTVLRRSLLAELGGFRSGFDGSQDYDLILRAVERTSRMAHIPHILYHWRKSATSTSAKPEAKEYAFEAGRRALEDALRRRGEKGRVEETPIRGRYRIRYALSGTPLVTIIIPTRDNAGLLRNCIRSIREKTTYAGYEILVVDNGSVEASTRQYLQEAAARPNCRVLRRDEPFNFSRLNNAAAREARGEYLVFLNNDTEIVDGGWIDEMLSHAQRAGVAAVGAKLLYSDRTVQHAGVVVGLGGIAGHAFCGITAEDPGYLALAAVVRNTAAVTAACMMMRRTRFEEMGGFDETLHVGFNDVDLCLRLLERGYRIVWTPFAHLFHYESRTRRRVDPVENQQRFYHRWRELLDLGDPYYNPNLDLGRFDYSADATDSRRQFGEWRRRCLGGFAGVDDRSRLGAPGDMRGSRGGGADRLDATVSRGGASMESGGPQAGSPAHAEPDVRFLDGGEEGDPTVPRHSCVGRVRRSEASSSETTVGPAAALDDPHGACEDPPPVREQRSCLLCSALRAFSPFSGLYTGLRGRLLGIRS